LKRRQQVLKPRDSPEITDTLKPSLSAKRGQHRRDRQIGEESSIRPGSWTEAKAQDPIGNGFVASLPRPGGNVTGFIDFEPTMASKWLELLKEIAPSVGRVAYLFNPSTATYADYYLEPLKAAAPSFAVRAIAAPVHDASELESVVAAQAVEPNGGLIVMSDAFMQTHRTEITSLAARYPIR
jgi:putative ABC transport system substrate-binding protein